MNDPVFTKTEVSPQFPGGQDEWRKYLIQNLNASIAVKEGWKPGIYTVTVQFIIDKEGNLSKFETMNYAGSKTAQHCIDIIKNGPKWLPAEQNAKKGKCILQTTCNFCNCRRRILNARHTLMNNDKNIVPGEGSSC